MKEGYKTSELYLTLGNMFAGILVLTGLLQAERMDAIAELVTQAIGGIVALASLLAYIVSRTEIKKKLIEKSRG